jgi:hypothetical protein
MMKRTEGRRLLQEHATAFTHGELARMVRRARPTVSLWLSGSRLPDVLSAAAMERRLGIPMQAWSQKPKPNGKP